MIETIALGVVAVLAAIALAYAASLRGRLAALAGVAAAKTELEGRIGQEAALSAERGRRLEAAESERAAARREAQEMAGHLARSEEARRQEAAQASEKLALLTEARARMSQEFKVLAGEILRQQGEDFSKANREQMALTLTPLKAQIETFSQSLAAAHTESTEGRAKLEAQFRHLTEQSARMTDETTALTRALKGESQTQGAWGEMILESILERSGLTQGSEYTVQESRTGEEGGRLRPDVVVTLPGDEKRLVIIDSKVSLTAFERHVNAADAEERARALREHVASLRNHIKNLGAKDYVRSTGTGLDYVVMFIPIEGALAAAVASDAALTGFAIEHNVAIATPPTLMIALRTVRAVWDIERRNRNADDIADRAGLLYDKFVGFAEDMAEIGNRLKQTQSAHDKAMQKLSTGTGNLVRQAELLRGLGARAGKILPATLLGRDGE